MAFGAHNGVCFSLFFITFLVIFSATARSPSHFSNDEVASSMVGRSLKVINLEDYGGPTAIREHDPWKGASRGGNAGRKG
ncbi:hypothetical protein D0Y65_030556 [Glycine soja]|uniref:Protein PSY3 n=1 Tax=Glycine soja TaxID=3848 RepID=A0A0B2RPV8_GLYSO|nr:hypothetical protein glysoja_037217 [Glycine soja]RZB80872.1 hypothetical protein D0Y65_030556 [Glycine soja]